MRRPPRSRKPDHSLHDPWCQTSPTRTVDDPNPAAYRINLCCGHTVVNPTGRPLTHTRCYRCWLEWQLSQQGVTSNP